MGNKIRLLKRIYRGLFSPLRKKVSANIVTLAPNEFLKGRTAVITGCTSGIGLAIAKAFLNAGANIVATGRNKDKLEKATDELLQLVKGDSKVYSYPLDVMESDKLERSIKEVVKLIPNHKIDILVNNAGLGGVSSATELQEYDIVMDTNLKAVYFLTKYVARHMISEKIEGNIVNIASSSSLRPAGGVYGLSKWGIRGLTEGFAKMLIKHNIVVNAVGPCATATPFMGMTNSEDLGSTTIPAKRLATPEEVANIAVVLASGMGRMIVGDIIYLSGGAGVITCDDVDYDFN